MYAMERHEHILTALGTTGRVSVADLADQLDVTAETIRRDLDALERAGHARRVHGGAVTAARASLAETTVAERAGQPAPRRSAAIAGRARLVPGDASRGAILLDAGTTTAALAERSPTGARPSAPPLTVVTQLRADRRDCSRQLRPRRAARSSAARVRGITSAAVGAATVDAARRPPPRHRLPRHQRGQRRLRASARPTSSRPR